MESDLNDETRINLAESIDNEEVQDTAPCPSVWLLAISLYALLALLYGLNS